MDLRMVRFLVVDELHLFQWAEESRELLALLFAGLAKTPQIVCGAPKNAVRNQRFLDVLLKSMALPVQIKIKDDGMNAIRVDYLAENILNLALKS